MANSSPLLAYFLFFVIIGLGVFHIQASHIVSIYQNQAFKNTSAPNTTYRTAFHFQPLRNWMNDPTGPMLYKGIYHLFYQYNPNGADWGNIVWAHSTSLDLVDWTIHPTAIAPSDKGDINGCWSGSVTFLPRGKPVILYTGLSSLDEQVQDLAVPKNLSDPFLIEWVKHPKNPLMAPTDTNQINVSSFRDPSTAWLGPDKRWRVLVGSKHHATGKAILYRSKDFIHWIKDRKPLHSARNTGLWECPDFYPVSVGGRSGLDWSRNGPGIKHVLKNSLDDTKHDYYTIGTYNVTKDIYVPDNGSVDGDDGLRYDYGKFYASKTFYDGVKRRRVLWGWVNESLPVTEYVKQGWAGVQAFPRTVSLDKSGKQLVQWPVQEIENLRTNKVDLHNGKVNKVVKGNSLFQIENVTAAQADVEISFTGFRLDQAEKMDPNWTNPQDLCSQNSATVKGGLGPFGLKVLASEDHKEYTYVFFRIFKAPTKHVVLMCSDQSKSSLNERTDKTTYGAFLDVDPALESLPLRILIDNSIVESFGGGGKVCITSRVYPTLALGNKAKIYASNDGITDVEISKMTAWSMKKAHIY